MGLFGRAKVETAPSRHESDALNGQGDGFYETTVRGESKHREHLAAVLKRHKRSGGWSDGRVPVDAFIIPLGAEAYGKFAVEVGGVRVGYVSDDWVKVFGSSYTAAADAVGREVAYACPAAICWKASRGDPLRDASVPLGVRLDLL